jgi:hypothetical protein
VGNENGKKYKLRRSERNTTRVSRYSF